MGVIYLPSMSALQFDIDRMTLYRPHIPLPETLHPGTPAPQPTTIHTPSAAPFPALTQSHAPRGGRSSWTPPTDLLIPPGIGLRTCIAACLGARETLLSLNSCSVICLAWSLCVSFRVNCCNHSDQGYHYHLSGLERQRALVFCGANVGSPAALADNPIHFNLAGTSGSNVRIPPDPIPRGVHSVP